MIATYARVSSGTQDTKSQEPELKAFAKIQEDNGQQVECYRDKFTGKSMERPAWEKLWADVLAGKVTKIVVWRLDRLGRTAKGLVTLRDELVERKIGFVSLRDGMDLSTPAGRLMFNVIASVAEYETEVRKERQLAGIERAKAEGKSWGGRKPGTRISVTAEKEVLVKRLAAEGQKIAVIARQVGLARKTVYAVLKKDAA
jgi:DNA invertase Pin-like site-specific DNA recombinase